MFRKIPGGWIFRAAAGFSVAIGLFALGPKFSVTSVASASKQSASQPAEKTRTRQSPADGEGTTPPKSPRRRLPINTGVLTSEEDTEQAPVKPRELLQDFGIDAARLAEFKEDTPAWSPAEQALLLRIMMRLQNIPRRSMEHWAQSEDVLQKLEVQPNTFRGEVFNLQGRVNRIEEITVPAPLQELFGIARIYRCHTVLGGGEPPAVIYTRNVPEKLPLDKPLDERIGMTGIFLKRETGSRSAAALVFVAERLAWYRDTLLGDLDMDGGLLDTIQNGQPLRPAENEAFYQMLAAARKAGAGELLRHAYNDLVFQVRNLTDQKKTMEMQIQQQTAPDQGTVDNESLARLQLQERLATARLNYTKKNAANAFVPLIETPGDFNGKLIMLRGTAYRIVKVRVTDPEIIDRFGINHYYQIDMLVNLEHKVKLVTPTSPENPQDEATEKVIWRHPATFCALSLPPGMPTGNKLAEPIRVAGFYFKNWRYETSEMKNGQVATRTAPMLIGRQPVWDARKPSGPITYAGLIAGGLFILALAGIWAVVWWTSRRDDAMNQVVRTQALGTKDPRTLDDLNLEANPIDFSYLDQQPHQTPTNEGPPAADPDNPETGRL